MHYYFPQKDDLILAVAQQYASVVQENLAIRTEKLKPGKPRLLALLDLIQENIQNRFCTAGVLAVESAYVPPAAQVVVRGFFDALQTWIREQLTAAGKKGKDADMHASVLLTAIEGSLMLDSLESGAGHLTKLREFVQTL